jgi:hypothetical protein
MSGKNHEAVAIVVCLNASGFHLTFIVCVQIFQSGLVCAVDGMATLDLATPCPEGYVCDVGTDSNAQFDILCPAGYSCDFGTTPESQYSVLCEAGFGCPKGTGFTQRNRFRCEPGFYCPPGSVSSTPEASQCPLGTTSLPVSTVMSDCFADSTSDICHVSPYQADLFDECLLAQKCFKTTGSNADYSSCFGNGLIQANYIFDEMLSNEVQVSDNFFRAEAMTIVKAIFDWRQLPADMKYFDHYRLIFNTFNKTVSQALDEVRPGFEGTWFGNKNVDKHGVISFNIMALRDTFLRFDITIKNGLFIENKNYTFFRNTMKFEVIRPSRAAPGSAEVEQFLLMLAEDKQNPVAPALNIVLPKIKTNAASQGNTQQSFYSGSLEPLVDFTGENFTLPLVPQVFAKASL